MKAGDIIKHNPTGETWTVAAVCNRTKMLLCCGWPESMAPWKECEMVKECDDTEHRKMLKGVMESCGGQLRGVWARRNLEELSWPTPLADTCEHGHLARKCEVCELEERAAEKSDLIQELTKACGDKNVEIVKLKAEVDRLRSVCRVAAGVVKASTNLIGDRKYVCGALNDVGNDLADAGKEATE